MPNQDRISVRNRCSVDHWSATGAGGSGADLDQVAELVGDPEAAADRAARLGADAAGEWLLDTAAVANLEHERPGLAPDRRGAGAAAVEDAVGDELAGGEDCAVDVTTELAKPSEMTSAPVAAWAAVGDNQPEAMFGYDVALSDVNGDGRADAVRAVPVPLHAIPEWGIRRPRHHHRHPDPPLAQLFAQAARHPQQPGLPRSRPGRAGGDRAACRGAARSA